MRIFWKTGAVILLVAAMGAHQKPALAVTGTVSDAPEAQEFDPSATFLPPDTSPSAGNILQLEASINGQPTNLIVSVHQLPDGKLALLRSEYAALRIAVPEGPADELLALDAIDMLAYVYDESRQRLEISLPAEMLQHTMLSGQLPDEATPLDPVAPGLVVNYSAYGATSYQTQEKLGAFDGASLVLNARAASRMGVLEQSGFLTARDFKQAAFTRLDTTWVLMMPSAR